MSLAGHQFNCAFFSSPRAVNAAIGTKGAIINATQEETGCILAFERNDDVVNGVATRLCRVGGPSIEALLLSMRKVWDVDENFTDARIAIADPLVSTVIGKAGVTIKGIMDNTGVQMGVSKQHEMGSLAGQMRMLSLKGEFEACMKAIEMVFEHLGEKMAEMMPSKRGGGKGKGKGKGGKDRNSWGTPNMFGGHDKEGFPNPSAADFTGEKIEVQFFIPSNQVNLAIGKGGSQVKRICLESGNPVISFAEADEDVNGEALRRCTIIGHLRCIVSAATRMSKLDKDQEEGSIILILPDANVSFIIGANGQKIKQITNNSWAFLNFVSSEEMGTLAGSERNLNIKGPPQAIAAAMEEVLNINLQAASGGRTAKNRPMEEEGGPATKRVKTEFVELPAPKKGCDVGLVLPEALGAYIEEEMITKLEGTFGVKVGVEQNEEDKKFYVSLSGEKSVQAQMELQADLLFAVGSETKFKWQLSAFGQ